MALYIVSVLLMCVVLLYTCRSSFLFVTGISAQWIHLRDNQASLGWTLPFPPRRFPLIQSLLTHVFPSIHFSFLLMDFSARTIRPRRFTETGCDLVEPLSHAETFSSVFKVLSLRFYKRLIPVEDVALTVMAFCPPRTSSGHTCKGHMFL